MTTVKTALLRLLELVLEGIDRLTHGAVTGLAKQPGESHAYEDQHPGPRTHD